MMLAAVFLLSNLLIHNLPENHYLQDFSMEADLNDCRKVNVSKSSYIVTGEVLEADLSAGIWSGVIASYKIVKYKVKTKVKGKLKADDEIFVAYTILNGEDYLDGKRPALSPEVFKKGNEHILVLEKSKYPPEVFTSQVGKAQVYMPGACSVLKADKEGLELIGKLKT